MQNVPEILDIYENEFNKLSERYFVTLSFCGRVLTQGLYMYMYEKTLDAEFYNVCIYYSQPLSSVSSPTKTMWSSLIYKSGI